MRAALMVLVVALAQPSLALASEAPVADPDASAVTVYASFPLSGPLAAVGQDLAHATQMAFADAAWRAGPVTLRLRVLDDGGTAGVPADPEKERANALAAAADGSAVAYLGPYFSSAARVSIPLLCAAGIGMVSPSASRDGLTVAIPGMTEPGEPESYYPDCPHNFARVAFRESVVGADGAAIAAQLGGRRAYIVRTSEQFLQLQGQGFAAAAAGVGLVVVGDETVDPTATDGVAERIVRSGADTLYLAAAADLSSVAEAVIKAVRAAAPSTLIVASPANVGPLGSVAEGVYATGWAVEVADYAGAATAWHDRFEAQFGPSVGRYPLYAYEAARALIAAIRRVGSAPTRDAVRVELRATKHFPGLLEHWSFDAAGDTTATQASVFRMTGGLWRDIGTIQLP